jgi:hypothetical protein
MLVKVKFVLFLNLTLLYYFRLLEATLDKVQGMLALKKLNEENEMMRKWIKVLI